MEIGEGIKAGWELSSERERERARLDESSVMYSKKRGKDEQVRSDDADWWVDWKNDAIWK
jgi:hypothetical protein